MLRVLGVTAGVLARTAVWWVWVQARTVFCDHTFYAFEPFGPEPIIRCLHCGLDG